MKKSLSLITAIAAVSLVGAPASFAQDLDSPFPPDIDGFKDPSIVNEMENTAESQSMAEIPVVTSFKTEGSKVMYKVSLDNPNAKVTSAKIVLNFPDVLSTTKEQIKMGSLLDTMNDELTVIDAENNTVTFAASTLTAVPASGELFTVEFDSNPGTIEQDYPFSVDISGSEVTDELNNAVVLTSNGIDMVKVGSAAMEEEEVKAKTGFGSAVAVLLLPLLTAVAYFRRKSL